LCQYDWNDKYLMLKKNSLYSNVLNFKNFKHNSLNFRLLEMLVLQNFINGEFVPSSSTGTVPIYEPATGAVYGSLPDSNKQDVDKAVDAAVAAFKM